MWLYLVVFIPFPAPTAYFAHYSVSLVHPPHSVAVSLSTLLCISSFPFLFGYPLVRLFSISVCIIPHSVHIHASTSLSFHLFRSNFLPAPSKEGDIRSDDEAEEIPADEDNIDTEEEEEDPNSSNGQNSGTESNEGDQRMDLSSWPGVRPTDMRRRRGQNSKARRNKKAAAT